MSEKIILSKYLTTAELNFLFGHQQLWDVIAGYLVASGPKLEIGTNPERDKWITQLKEKRSSSAGDLKWEITSSNQNG